MQMTTKPLTTENRPMRSHRSSLVLQQQIKHLSCPTKTRIFVPFHEACVNQQLCQVLTDGSAGWTHHEMQDDLPALCGVTVQAADVPGMAIWTQRASFVGPCSAPVINTDANTASALWAAFPSQNSTAVLKWDQSDYIWIQMHNW